MADINDAISFFQKLKSSKIARVKFFKKDGSERIMKCTLDFDLIPKSDKPKSVDMSKILNLISNSKIIHVYDLEKKGWRSIPFDRAEWMEDTASKTMFSIKN